MHTRRGFQRVEASIMALIILALHAQVQSTQTKHKKLDGIGIAYGDCLGVQSFLLSFAGREDI